MTVCVAAICQWFETTDPAWRPIPMIVGAADRMLTAADIQYEPAQGKMFRVTPTVVVMIAGDAAVHSELLQIVERSFSKDQEATVPTVAQAYASEISEYRKRRCEALFLRPVGLDYESFISRQTELAPQLVDELTGRMQRFRVDVEAIVTGVDPTTALPHVYVVQDPGTTTSHDLIGFAAIGIGANHAASHMMSMGYLRTWGFARALFQLFSAKKRAEVAPGVGEDTDMLYIDKQRNWVLSPENDPKGILKRLLGHYDGAERTIRRARKAAEGKVVSYVQGLTTQQPQAPSPPPPEAAPGGDQQGAA